MAPRAGVGALVAGLGLAFECGAGLLGGEAGIDRDGGLLLGEKDPVALLLRQVAPGNVDVIAQGDQDIAQILPAPGGGPGGDGALADGQRGVRHHGGFRHLVDPAQAVALGAGALGRVGREILRIEHRLVGGVATGAGIEHPHQAGKPGHAAHGRTTVGLAALLLQGHRRWQAFDGLHLGHPHLVDQPSGIGRHRFEVAALGLGIEGAEGQRRFARAGYPGEHHQGIAGDIHVDVLQVVLAGTADGDETGTGGGGHDGRKPCLRACRFGPRHGAKDRRAIPDDGTEVSSSGCPGSRLQRAQKV